MRCDKTVTFQKEEPRYNPIEGKEKLSIIEKEDKRANVTDASEETIQVIFGEWKKGVKVVRLINKTTVNFTHVVIDGERYKLVKERRLRHKRSYVVEKVGG